jgi:hypothetical protein
MFVGMISLFFTFIPNVLSQSENVEVLSYSWYISSYGTFIVVGEVQNLGSTNLEYIYLSGIVYSTDGENVTWSYSKVFSTEIISQQKVPFIMYFYPENSLTGDISWISIGIDHVEFGVVDANETDNYQYPDLEIVNDSPYIDSNGLFTITGSVRNTGNQAAGRLWVVATFYNATGSVIATGFSNYLTPDSLQAGQTTSFTLTTVDSIPELASEIADCALLIQTEALIIPEFTSWIILPLFVIATLAVIIYGQKLKK